jgi:hypothetical protein
MPTRLSFRLPHSLWMGLLIAVVGGILVGFLAWIQIERERRNDLEEMDRRAYVIAHQMAYPVRTALQLPDKEAAVVLGSALEGYRRLTGLALYRPDGRLIAAGKGVGDFTDTLQKIVARALESSKDLVDTRRVANAHIHILASLMRTPQGQPEGVLVVVHDLFQLDERATSHLYQMGFWLGLIVLLLLVLVMAGAWIFYDRLAQPAGGMDAAIAYRR